MMYSANKLNKQGDNIEPWQTPFPIWNQSVVPCPVLTVAFFKQTLTPWKESYDQPRQLIKKQRHSFADKDPSSQGYGFSSGHVWMWELDHKESWAPKNWCFWTVVLEKTLESLLDSKEIQPVKPKGNQSWIFIETPMLGPPDAKNWLIWKDRDAGKDWRQEEKGMTEDEMVGWHHWLDGHEWVNSRRWWWTGRPGVLHSMGLQRVGPNWATGLNWLKLAERSLAQGFWKARPRPGCPMTLLCDLGQTVFSGLSLGFLQGRLNIPRLKISTLCNKPRNHPNSFFHSFISHH